MKPVEARSIREKLIRMTLTIMTLVLVPVVALMVVVDFYLLRKVTVRDLTILGEAVAYNSSAALAFQNPEDGENVLQALRAEPNIRQAVLFTMDEKIFAVYRPEEKAPDSLPKKIKDWSPFSGGKLRHLTPVSEGGTQLGWLLIRYDMHGLQIRLSFYLVFTLFLLALTFLATWFISRIFQHRISGPIVALRKVVRAVTETHDYDRRATKTTDDEIGSLTSAFNEMLEKIATKEEELETSEERLRVAVESSGIGVWERDLITKRTTWIGSIFDQFEMKKSTDKSGELVTDLVVHPDDELEFFRRVQDALKKDADYEFDFRVRAKSGEYRTIRSRGHTFGDKNGNPIRIVGAIIDITDLRAAEAEILELNKNLERRVHERTLELEQVLEEIESFNYSVSHDLRTPLRAINGFSQALLEDYHDQIDETGQNFLHRIAASCTRMGQLIDDLLYLSKITQLEMNKEPLDLSPIAEEIVSTLQEEEPREDISIKIESDLKTVGDPRLLSVALENMLQNAWKFTARAENPKIEVGRLNNGGREVFYVKDNGAGFDQEYANTLFGVFQRLHKSTEFEGTGIGLATVDRIIKRHGGEIWGVGDLDKGATFYFSIPS